MTYRLSHLQRLNGSNLGGVDSTAVRLNYAKRYARGSEDFQAASLLADFMPFFSCFYKDNQEKNGINPDPVIGDKFKQVIINMQDKINQFHEPSTSKSVVKS